MPKRPRSGDPPLSRQVRTRSMGLPPTPDDDALSPPDPPPAADSASAADLTDPAEEKVPPGPANPGVVRNRHKCVLARLTPDCDIIEEFAQLRRDHNLSNEQVILKLITTYEISMATLNRISSNVYPTCLSYFFSHILLTLSTNHSHKVARIV